MDINCSSSGELSSVLLRSDSEAGADGRLCSIAVLYEGIPARQSAINLCDSLIQRFFEDLEFDITWWGFKYLNDPQVAAEAVEAAAKVDVLVVSVQSSEEFPLAVKAWFERWLLRREHGEGALVLLQKEPDSPGHYGSPSTYFHLLTERARLDFVRLT